MAELVDAASLGLAYTKGSTPFGHIIKENRQTNDTNSISNNSNSTYSIAANSK